MKIYNLPFVLFSLLEFLLQLLIFNFLDVYITFAILYIITNAKIIPIKLLMEFKEELFIPLLIKILATLKRDISIKLVSTIDEILLISFMIDFFFINLIIDKLFLFKDLNISLIIIILASLLTILNAGIINAKNKHMKVL